MNRETYSSVSMTSSSICACCAIAAAALGVMPIAMAQEEGRETAWGVPDFSGVYAQYTTAPLQRPVELGTKEFYTAEEFAANEPERVARGERPYTTDPGTASDVHYDNDQFGLRANEGFTSENRRTSVVNLPANGRIPELLPAAVARREARETWRRGREFDGPEFRSLTERCILWSFTLPPLLPGGYNNNLQIFQSPGYVMIQAEMGDPRMIPTDGRNLPEDLLPQWNGTSVGRWEDETLVIETAGFHPDAAWRGSSEHLRVTERVSRVDADTLEYAFRVEDPETWAEPWGGVYPLTKMDNLLFEYACSEGNYGMANILSGQRAEERAAE